MICGNKYNLLLSLIFLTIGKPLLSNNQMEINQIIKEKKIDEFINSNFERIGIDNRSPIFPHKANYIITKNLATFCTLPIINCWAFKKDTSYTFYILVKDSDNLRENICKWYGPPESELTFEINERPPGPPSYSWDFKGIRIFLRKYINIRNIDEYSHCNLIMVGNMNFSETVILPDKTI